VIIHKWLMNGLVVATLIACTLITACGKKGSCGACSSNSDCDSGSCAEYSDGNNKMLLCSGSNTCSVPQ
jgi:hypothetical protein